MQTKTLTKKLVDYKVLRGRLLMLSCQTHLLLLPRFMMLIIKIPNAIQLNLLNAFMEMW